MNSHTARIGRPKSVRGTWTEIMSGICGLVPTLPSWRMKLRAWHRQISWSATGYGRSALVPNADPFPNGVVEGSKQSDVAVPTQEQQKRQPQHLNCHNFYSISPVYLGHGFEAVLRLTASSRNDLHSLASVSTREGASGDGGTKCPGKFRPQRAILTAADTVLAPGEPRWGRDLSSLRSRAQILPSTGPHPPLRRPLQNKRMAAT